MPEVVQGTIAGKCLLGETLEIFWHIFCETLHLFDPSFYNKTQNQGAGL
jgi:hypothetical protein